MGQDQPHISQVELEEFGRSRLWQELPEKGLSSFPRDFIFRISEMFEVGDLDGMLQKTDSRLQIEDKGEQWRTRQVEGSTVMFNDQGWTGWIDKTRSFGKRT